MFPLLRQGTDCRIGELFPAVVRVRSSLPCPYRQRGIEQQHALTCPLLKIARARDGHADVVVQLLEDVLQTRWERNAIGHRKREAMRLSRAMIRVLAENDHLHLIERRKVERIENQWPRRKNGILPLLTDEERLEVGEIRCLKLRLQHLVPTFIDVGFSNLHG